MSLFGSIEGSVGSPECNVIKLEGAEIHFDGKKPPALIELIDRLRWLRDPEKYAEEEAHARSKWASGLAKAYEQLRKSLPSSLTDKQVLCIALGYPSTPGEADNLSKVFMKADSLLNGRECQVDHLSAGDIDMTVKGASGAYDEDVQDLWSKLIAEEVSERCKFSRPTFKALDQMDGALARAFKTVCENTLHLGDDDDGTLCPIIGGSDSGGWTYLNGRLPSEELHELAGLGIIEFDRYINITIGEAGVLLIGGERRFLVSSDGEGQVHFGKLLFLRGGNELARLCNLGNQVSAESLKQTSSRPIAVTQL